MGKKRGTDRPERFFEDDSRAFKVVKSKDKDESRKTTNDKKKGS